MSYRELTPDEIDLLIKTNCSSTDWNNIKVAEKFTPIQIKNVNFSGEVFIGNNVQIRNVINISNYRIEDDVLLENISSLTVEGETTFGNGLKISVLNEGGGRELMIYDRLSSQIAYLLVTCRHYPVFVEKLETIIRNYSDSRKSKIGKIGKGTSIKNCGVIRNVWIENSSTLEGVTCLKEGTLLSCIEDPIFIGTGVIAKDFIIQSGSTISDGALLDNCFIGQGVKIGKQYSAENCAFFSNSEGFHGEAVSIFAGPYTVTHHKSSLLIAAIFSFYNAGSGSNQSNHMYKLGPVHQGILERGSKTGSFSYMLWPSRVGPFSVVIGKHYTTFDAGEFPFSYINEEGGKSLLTPAMNLFTVGTRRDSQKWPARDRRKDPVKYDILHFDLLNPYIIGKILEGSNRMKELLEKSDKDREYVSYKGLHIKRLLLKTCIKYYEMAIKIYIGEELLKKISEKETNGNEDRFSEVLKYDHSLYSEKWIDAAGMLISRNDYELIINKVATGKLTSLEELNDEIHLISKNYKESSWAWCANLIEKRFNLKIDNITKDQLSNIILDWKENRIKLNNMILKDAEKEFDQTSKIGFGIDGDEETRNKDFQNVRGRYEENKFVLELKKESDEITAIADRLIKALIP
ncbi:MAG: DUF4954 family protein [Melioribacteraceae bacterium]|nr:DUF4954 family protein [Melioribacteraceae bacterium]